MDKKVIHEVLEGKNLEQNLPFVFGKMATVNHIYAGTSFAMQYFSFYESIADGETKLPEEAMQILKQIADIVMENIVGSFDGSKREKAIEVLDDIRKTITAKMQVLTAYTDIFSLYEYTINRLELKYEELAEIDDDTAAREILQYIFMEKDNVVVNTRIRQMLSQMPVRMSRGKFCDLVKGSFEHYLGMDKKDAKDFVFRIESSAGLYRPYGFSDLFPEIFDSWQTLSVADWSALDSKEFQEKQVLLEKITEKLHKLTDAYYSLEELVNLLYAWLLNIPYSSGEAFKQTEVLFDILRRISKSIIEDSIVILEDSNAAFAHTEGVLEDLLLELQKNQGVLEELAPQIEKPAQSMMLGKQLSCLVLSSVLLKDSLFIPLEKEESEGQSERQDLDQLSKDLCEKLLGAWSVQPRNLNRAMLAAVLAELPVFFGSQNDVMDYVRSSLAGCHDLAEKIGSVRLMKQLMEG